MDETENNERKHQDRQDDAAGPIDPDSAIPSAKNYLGVAGDSPGSPQLDTFGPDMTLARQLLEKGEKDAVIAFLGKIAKFWKGHEEKIQDWQKAIQQGQTTF